MRDRRHHHGEDDIPPQTAAANRLLVRIARLPRPFRQAIGWMIFLTLAVAMFLVTLMPVWWSK
ncbi:hypothetical protein [Rhizobium leguminosarum]|uniref:hypothetical protein n=1 Tax=Rhizobium leguminosarum TaxID=384 RepID=UPI00143FB762|nr:hypothetical protein [Rhizobium leguminosarum]NKL22959.1 hypothetical protein [Rhizobium leguminosarum bv. viciae]